MNFEFPFKNEFFWLKKGPMKKIIMICISFLSFNLMADCYNEITMDGTHSSRVFKLNGDEFEEYDKLTPKMASKIVDVLIQRETSCSYKKVGGDVTKITCLKFPNSQVTCEVPTSLGYFIVHRNSFGSFDHSIMYARWD